MKIPETALKHPVDGRLYLFTSTGNGAPVSGPNWFSPEPFYAVDVTLDGGGFVELSGVTKGFPGSLGELEEGAYRIQALFDFDVYHSNHANGEGNLYSEVQEVNWTGDNVLEFELSKVIKGCLLYTSPSPRDQRGSRMPSSA